jgi:hypothetical protein
MDLVALPDGTRDLIIGSRDTQWLSALDLIAGDDTQRPEWFSKALAYAVDEIGAIEQLDIEPVNQLIRQLEQFLSSQQDLCADMSAQPGLVATIASALPMVCCQTLSTHEEIAETVALAIQKQFKILTKIKG